jgi:hypothetical protein
MLTGHEGLEGAVEVYLSFFNLGPRLGLVVNATPRPLYPRERDLVPIMLEAGAVLDWCGKPRPCRVSFLGPFTS